MLCTVTCRSVLIAQQADVFMPANSTDLSLYSTPQQAPFTQNFNQERPPCIP